MSPNLPIKNQSNGNELLPPWRWGIFRPSDCSGVKIVGKSAVCAEQTVNIYRALKSSGFRETYWQYVYPGQIGGLIYSPRSGLIEHHIRFYSNGSIYSEIEFGRSVILHFFNRRLYLNNYLIAKISKKISKSDREFFANAVQEFKNTAPYDWNEWSLENKFYTDNIKRQIKFFSVLGDWRFLAVAMFVSYLSAVSFQDGSKLFPILALVMIGIYFFAPKRS